MGRRYRPGLLPHGLVILYEDQDFLVVDKPARLLTIGTESDKSRTAYFILTDYVRKGCARSRNRVFVVHRLGPGNFRGPRLRQERRGEAPLAGRVGRDGEEVSCRRSRPLPEERGDHHVLPGREQSARHVLHVRPGQGKAVPHGLSSAQADEGLRLAGSVAVDGQEEPDPRASRRHRTSDRGRSEVWQREAILPLVSRCTPGRSPSSTPSAAGD